MKYAQIESGFLCKKHIVYNFYFCYYKSRNIENAFKIMNTTHDIIEVKHDSIDL